jgi:hypothetical protein
MMACMTGAFNTKGFTAGLAKEQLPSADHLTFEGAFNEIDFPI